MTLADALLWVAGPFVLITFCFGFIKGDNDYYDSDAYKGHGTAHPVKFEETTCKVLVRADSTKVCHLPENKDESRGD
tara:strand:- start:856 stop:1086 length:231 start_codon:yes stop_codon:yes gene_type:complete